MWKPVRGVDGTESVLSAAEPVPVCRPVADADADADVWVVEGSGATGRTKIGSKLVREGRRAEEGGE